ncbi:LDCC motif putative metal-binding protein [Natranaerofaba carboxydovora]|nr:LDCC motif putative metal-binding protein [Natranaerofaba carboxydovora]
MIKAFKNFLKRLEKTNKQEFGNKKLSCHNVNQAGSCEHEKTKSNKK